MDLDQEGGQLAANETMALISILQNSCVDLEERPFDGGRAPYIS